MSRSSNTRTASHARADPTYRGELARTLLDSAARSVGSTSPGVAEARCRRALALIADLIEEGAEPTRSEELLVVAHLRLAAAIARNGRAAEAKVELETASILGARMDRAPASVKIDAARVRLDLAKLCPEEDAVAALDSLASEGHKDRVNPGLLKDLHERRAARLRVLGREQEAREADARVGEARPGRSGRERDRQ